MKRIIALLVLVCAITSLSAQGIIEPYKWNFEVRELPNDEVELQFVLKLENGWRIYSQYSDVNGPVPIKFCFNKSASYTRIGLVNEPTPKKEYDEIFGVELSYHTFFVTFTQKIKRKTKSNFKVKGSMEYQLCYEGNCRAPDKIQFVFNLVKRFYRQRFFYTCYLFNVLFLGNAKFICKGVDIFIWKTV